MDVFKDRHFAWLLMLLLTIFNRRLVTFSSLKGAKVAVPIVLQDDPDGDDDDDEDNSNVCYEPGGQRWVRVI